jgi:hypothetical protein
MSLEQGSAWHEVTGHAKLRKDEIFTALYLILSCFYSSQNIYDKSEGSGNDIFAGLWPELEESFLQERIIYVAIRLRIIDDSLIKNSKTNYSALSKQWICGKIHYNYRDAKKIREQQCSIREACNKIIHAEIFNWNRKGKSINSLEGLKPKITVYGKLKNESWKCTISVEDFIRFSIIQLHHL